jgi:hypothetical protein
MRQHRECQGMDPAAIAQLRVRHAESVASARMYRQAAEDSAENRDFYLALAFTYERAAREMHLMLDRVERLSGANELAA